MSSSPCALSIDDAKLLRARADPDRVVETFLGMAAKTVLLMLGEAGAIVGMTGERHHIMPRAVKALPRKWRGRTPSGEASLRRLCGRTIAPPRPPVSLLTTVGALSVTRMGTIASVAGRVEFETELSSSQAR